MQIATSSATMLADTFAGRRVLLTGDTGFKGAWLAEWLCMLGARVFGLGLAPNTSPALFDLLKLSDRIEHETLDIRDRASLRECVLRVQPDFVFHLAAQPLVRLSYKEPVETWSSNVMGTVHLLDALVALDAVYEGESRTCAVVFVTSDKCYENREWVYGYREEDALGGHDPYSSSKAAAEIAVAAYRRSYFGAGGRVPRVGVASARAGNVIGGGDWSSDRIVPDCIRHLAGAAPVPVRNPRSTRPWQHVLEPLSGYLRLAAAIGRALNDEDVASAERLCGAFNFGPPVDSGRDVRTLVEEILRYWPGSWVDESNGRAPHESARLNLSSEKAYHDLNWISKWGFPLAVQRTVDWYRGCLNDPSRAQQLTQDDIEAYRRDA